MRIRGLPLKAGQTPRISARALHDPDIVRVREGDVGGADRRRAQHTRGPVLIADRRRREAGQNQNSEREKREKETAVQHKRLLMQRVSAAIVKMIRDSCPEHVLVYTHQTDSVG